MAYTYEELVKMGAKPKEEASSGSSYTYEQLQQMGAKPVASSPSEPAPKGDGALASIGKAVFKGAVMDPFKALIVRPGVRFGEAVGQGALELGALTGNKGFVSARDRGREMIGKERKTPFGVTVEGVKAFGEGGAKQLAGESLEAGADIAQLAMGGGAVNALTKPATFAKGAIQGGLQGIKTGTLYGASHGVSQGLQQDKSAGKIVEQGVSEGVLGGVTGGIVGGLIGGVTGSIRGAINRHKAILEGLNQKRPPASVAGFEKVGGEPISQGSLQAGGAKMPEAGDITGFRKDRVAQEAIKQGIDPLDIQLVKNADNSDKKVFRDMYNIAAKSAQDKTYALEHRPVEKAGESLITQVKHIVSARKNVGAELGEVAKSMKQVPLDVTPTINKFMENLDDAGIKVVNNVGDLADDLSPVQAFTQASGGLDFSDSRYADQPAVQRALSRAYDSLVKSSTNGQLTPAEIISTRQKMFTNLNYAKQANEIIPGDFAETILDNIYDTLDDPVKAANPKYGELAQKYAQSSDSLRRFGSLMGTGFDLNLEKNVNNLRAGEVGQRILGNASAKPLSIVQGVAQTAKDLGYKGTGDVGQQFLFSSFLEDFFGSTQSQSLQGQMQRGFGGATEAINAAEKVASGDKMGLVRQGINLIRNVTPQARKEALEKLLGISVGALKTR